MSLLTLKQKKQKLNSVEIMWAIYGADQYSGNISEHEIYSQKRYPNNCP
jgi:hypothetical protein